jgi:predicted aconitase with swiveling domain
MSNSKKFGVKIICPGEFSAPALITQERISLLGGADAENGLFCDPRSTLDGHSFAGKALIFTSGKGSSLWSSILGAAKRLDTAPAAIINLELDTFVVFACVVCDIPMLQLLDKGIFNQIKNGDLVTFNPAGNEIIVNMGT